MAKGNFKFDLKRFEPNDDLQCMFDFFNELWFDYELPYVCVGFYKHEKKHKEEYGSTLTVNGAKFPFYILLNPYFRDWPQISSLTLLHEMVHVKNRNEDADHGPKFKKDLRRLIVAGAFDEFL